MNFFNAAVVLGLALAWLLVSRPCHAEDINQAVKLYKKGYAQLQRARYKKALSLFTQARENLPKERRYRKTFVAFQYFIGLCHYHLGHKKRARRSFEVYLQSGFKQPQKAKAAKQMLAKLKTPVVPQKRQPPVVTRRAPPRIPPPRRPQRPAITAPTLRRSAPPKKQASGGGVHPGAIVVFATGVAAVVGGVVAGVLAKEKVDEAQETFRQLSRSLSASAKEVSVPYREGENLANLSNSLTIGGGVVAGVGVLLLITWRTRPSAK